MPLALQYLIIAIAALLAALYVWRSRFPGSWRKTRLRLARHLLREGRPHWQQAVGRRLAPEAGIGKGKSCSGGHCGGGCG